MANANEAYGILVDAMKYIELHDGVQSLSIYANGETGSASVIVTEKDGTRYSQSICRQEVDGDDGIV